MLLLRCIVRPNYEIDLYIKVIKYIIYKYIFNNVLLIAKTEFVFFY